MRRETRPLRGDSPGAGRNLTAYHYEGRGGGPRVYLQAGLHADEMPGVLILQHLLDLLDRAEAAGQIAGDICVVPMANPIGLAQWQNGRPQGRFDADTAKNFNRFYPELDKLVGDDLEANLTPSADENRKIIRAAFRAALDRTAGKTDGEDLRLQLLRWSCDADYVLDLHCDHHAVLHLYASTVRPDDTSRLCRSVGAKLALVQAVSGGNAFDEAHTVPWLRLAERFAGRYPIPMACFSSTLEYRGQFDVSDDLAAADARNLMTFLAAIGTLADDAAPRPAFADAPHLPLGGAAEVFAPQGGVLSWTRAPGDQVAAGEVIAHVTDPVTRDRVPVISPVDGMLFRQELWRAVLRGQGLGHVAGTQIVREGELLSD